MDNSIKLIVWAVFILFFGVIYYLQKRQTPTLTESANLALASGGLVTSIGLLYSLMMPGTVKQVLEKEVGFDITGFYIGAIAVCWVSLQPIAQLLQPNSFLGTVDDCQVNTGKIIYLKLSCRTGRMYRVVVTEDLMNQILERIRKNPKFKNNSKFRNITNPNGLVGEKITILDVSPISTGSTIIKGEIRVSLPDQLVVKS